jgi:glycosyltransferase involved in cell wall biosynthesis
MPISLAFITLPSIHQYPFGGSLRDILGDDFSMIVTRLPSEERAKMGWGDSFWREPWILKTWESEQAQSKMRECLNACDVVIYGGVSADLVRDRIKSGKLTFRHSERLFKRGFLLGFPWWLRRLARDFWPLDLPSHHLLCAGDYCALDHRRVRLFKGRMWKWGYFIEVPGTAPPLARLAGAVRLLWAGRMVDLKRVDLILKAAGRLRASSPRFTVDLIGDGAERNRLTVLREKLGLQEVVRLLPFMPVEQVRDAMRQADIYVMPSNYLEGWGTVIGEAMAAGCCVVSSTAPGAAPWLIEHGRTGYLFPSGDLDALCAILSMLIDNPGQCRAIGLAAWQKMHTKWSPEVAAERFVHLAAGLLGRGVPPDYQDGPCSRA